MISQEIQDAINDQIGDEFYAAYLYLGMMGFFEGLTLPGFSRWMRLQAQEEVAHAMKLVDFLLDRGGTLVLGPIQKPHVNFSSPIEAMEAALEHEKKVTALINELYEKAVTGKDYAAQVLLQWFISEQVEEEKTAGDIVEQLRLAGSSASALLVLDGRLGERQVGGEEGGE